jgi:hypothetical protein
VVEAGELPGAEVAGEDEDAVAAAAGGEVVLKAFVAEELLGRGAGGAGHAAKLGHLPAEISVEGAEGALAFGDWHVGEGEGEIAEADAAEARDEIPGERADGGAQGARGPTREPFEDGDNEAKAEVLQPLAERGALKDLRLGSISQ